MEERVKNNEKIVPEIVTDEMDLSLALSIKGPSQTPPSPQNSFLQNLSALINPIGTIAGAISQILHYRYQIRMLEVEAQRIEREAKVKHHQIERAYEVAIRALEERRKTLEASFQVAADNIRNINAQRTDLTKQIVELSKALVSPQLSIHEKEVISTTIKEISTLCVNLGQEGCASLQLIVENTKKSFEGLPRPTQLPTPQGNWE